MEHRIERRPERTLWLPAVPGAQVDVGSADEIEEHGRRLDRVDVAE
jgi:hypothetical protein